MNLWEVALIIIAVTVMVVNIWQMIISTRVLLKTLPLLDKTVKFSDLFMKQMLSSLEEDDD